MSPDPRLDRIPSGSPTPTIPGREPATSSRRQSWPTTDGIVATPKLVVDVVVECREPGCGYYRLTSRQGGAAARSQARRHAQRTGHRVGVSTTTIHEYVAER